MEFKAAGNAAYGAGDFAKAVEEYSKAVEALTDDVSDESIATLATVLSNRAQCQLKLGDNEKAVADCTACLELAPSNVKALFRRATALERLGQTRGAMRDYDECARLDPAQAKAVAKAKRRMNARIRKAFAGGQRAGSGGRKAFKGSSSAGGAGGAGAGALPPGGVGLDGLTKEEMNELMEVQERGNKAKAEVQMAAQREARAASDKRRVELVRGELGRAKASHAWIGVGKAYIREPMTKVAGLLETREKDAHTRAESARKQGEYFKAKKAEADKELSGLVARHTVRQRMSKGGR